MDPLSTFTEDEFLIARTLNEQRTLTQLSQELGFEDIRTLRTLAHLEEKGIVELDESEEVMLTRTRIGDDVAKKGLPEARFLAAIKDRSLSMDALRKKLDPEEFNVSVGLLKKRGAITLGNEVSITQEGLALLDAGFPLASAIGDAQRQEDTHAHELITRGLFERIRRKVITARLTEQGRGYDYAPRNYAEHVTSEMIKDGSFKKRSFRAYHVASPVPRMTLGRRHFMNEAITFVRQVWIDMGFVEMRGDYVQQGFWNFDALFTPQDHPARDMQDTFFLRTPSTGSLKDARLLAKIKKTHESGWTTGSTGYGQEWRKREALKNVLRTHTTCLSARTIADLSMDDLPAKFFSVGRVFRNESVDWKHLFEFDQVEGIVIDKGVDFTHLKGYLEVFFAKLGYERIRLRPAYFPYTEMSVEIDVLHPRGEWIELGGAGIFRPEVVKPLLGKDVPVLAWGLGFGRILTDYYSISDLREFHANDLAQLREMRGWV